MSFDLDSYTPTESQKKQLDILFEIIGAAHEAGIPLFITGGYGLDALYGKLTRDHRDIDIYINSKDAPWLESQLEKLGFVETGETIGEVGKREYVNEKFSKDFTIEYGLLENAQKLVERVNPNLNYVSWFPNDPIGLLAGKQVPVPVLDAFELAIKINNSAIAKNTEPYRNQEWMDAVLPILRKKYAL